MTEKRLPMPKYYYGLDGNISDGKNIYRTKNMPKEDVNEFFLNEKQLGSNSLMDCLNNLYEENIKLKKIIEEDEKLIQSTYDELTKLRCIKKNLARIKSQWDWIMESIQYD